LSDAPDGGIVGKGGCHRPHLTTWHISGIGSARSRSKLSKLPLDVAGIETGGSWDTEVARTLTGHAMAGLTDIEFGAAGDQ